MAKDSGRDDGAGGAGGEERRSAGEERRSAGEKPPRKKSKDKGKRRKSTSAMLNLLHTHNLLGTRSNVAMLGTAMPVMSLVPEQVPLFEHFVVAGLPFLPHHTEVLSSSGSYGPDGGWGSSLQGWWEPEILYTYPPQVRVGEGR
jgi:hypothetical protein